MQVRAVMLVGGSVCSWPAAQTGWAMQAGALVVLEKKSGTLQARHMRSVDSEGC